MFLRIKRRIKITLEDFDEIKKNIKCGNYEDLDEFEKKILLEKQYHKQMLSRHGNRLGECQNPEYYKGGII